MEAKARAAAPPRKTAVVGSNGSSTLAQANGSNGETVSPEEFRHLRAQLEAFLEAHFGRLSPECREEVLNDALLALHKVRTRDGNSAASTPEAEAYVKHAAVSLAIDQARRAGHPVFGAEAHDPSGALLSELLDAGPSPEEQAEAALSDRELAELARELSTEEAGVMVRSVLWGWAPGDVMADLGLSRRRYERLRARALMKVARRLEEAGGELWARGKSRLIAAVIAGRASAPQVKQVQALAKQSAEFRLALAKYEATLHSVAAAIPADAALRAGHKAGLIDRAVAIVDRTREAVGGALGRGGGEGGEPALGQQLASGGTRGGAGALGGSALAKLGSSGIGAKVIAACLAGGAAGGCLAAGVVPGVHLPDAGQRPTSTSPATVTVGDQRATPTPPVGPAANPELVTVTNETPPATTTEPPPAPPATTTTTAPTVTSTTTMAPIAPSTPPSQQEFGVASAATSTSSSGSSGGSTSDSGSGSAAKQEFSQP